MRTLTVNPFRSLRPFGPDEMALALAGKIADWRVAPAWTDATTPRTNRPVRFFWAGKFVHHGALGYVTSCELA